MMQCHLYTVRNIYSCLHYRSNVCNQIKIWGTLYILVQYSEIPIILKKKPVEISKQDDQKFKLCYELENDHDLIIVISVINSKPLTINLVTSYIRSSNRRRRKDGERVESE